MSENAGAPVHLDDRPGVPGSWISVQVPATAANLGPGFDCFGLALERRDEVSARLSADGLRIDVEGVGAGDVPTDDTHLVVRAMSALWQSVGLELPPVWLRCRNSIPHGGGQGSSAAAIVGGLLLGRALLPVAAHPAAGTAVTTTRLLQLAADMEGHPDNVAPALLGGFTIAWTRQDGNVSAVRRDVHPDLRAVLFSAAAASATSHSRTLLPQDIPHADAAANAACAALLVHAVTTDPGYLFEATQDRLHQRYRASSMPASWALLTDLRAAGIAAVISGAGPSVLAFTATDLDLTSWQRTGFDVQQVPISVSGATICDRSLGSKQMWGDGSSGARRR